MSRHPIVFVLLKALSVAMLLNTGSADEGRLEPFAPQSRWLALGDSITQNGAYAHQVEVFYRTRYPTRKVVGLNAGISGDTAGGALRRYAWDIAPQRPTVVTIMLGMNDVDRDAYRRDPPVPQALERQTKALDSYRTNLNSLVERLQADGVHVILMTPSLYDETGRQDVPAFVGVQGALSTCGTMITQLGRDRGLGVIEVGEPMRLLNQRLQERDTSASLIGPDRVHPGHPGHFVMASLLLRAQGVQSLVSRTTIALDASMTAHGEHVEIRDLRRDGAAVTWTSTSASLPFPLPREAGPAVEWTSFVQELNQEMLTVSGLAAGRWTLLIDQQAVATESAETWASGVDLASLPRTPALQQAREVARLLMERRKRMASLRAIAYVEHVTPGATLPTTLDAILPFVEARVAKMGPNHHYTRQATTYRTVKPQQETLASEAEDFSRQADAAALPVAHVFRLEPVATPRP